MNPDLTLVLILLGVCMFCFIINKPRIDIVALLAMITLPLLGIISFKDAISGFSDQSIMLIALMFIMGEGLVRTGVSYKMGLWILKKSANSPSRLIVFLMATVATVGAVMSSTGIVALFIPIVLSITSQLKISPSKLMMPLSFAGLISGMMSLVATPPNMVLNGVLVREGHVGFSFFSFTPIGVIVLLAGVIYMLYARRFLGNAAPAEKPLDRKNFSTFIIDYQLGDKSRIFSVQPNSPAIGKMLKDLPLRSAYEANIACIERKSRFDKTLLDPRADTVIQEGDMILAYMGDNSEHSIALQEDLKWLIMPLRGPYFKDFTMEIGMTEIAIPPNSSLIGKNILESRFRSQFGVSIVGMRHDSAAVKGDILCKTLNMGDILLVVGPWNAIRKFQKQTQNFIVFNMPSEFDNAVAAPGRAQYALISLAVMLVLMVGGIVPNAMAALIGCLLMVFFKCIDMDGAYRSINWPSVILIIGMMPFALALEKTGGVEIASNALLSVFGDHGPRAVLAGIFALTMLIGLFISNTVTAVLLAPVVMTAARMLEVSPYPFAMAVAIAASTSFMTPISSPVNTLVWGPGRYKFTDFMKIGIPFSFIVMAISVIFIPWLFPFMPFSP